MGLSSFAEVEEEIKKIWKMIDEIKKIIGGECFITHGFSGR